MDTAYNKFVKENVSILLAQKEDQIKIKTIIPQFEKYLLYGLWGI